MLPRETSNSPLQPDVSTVDKAARKIDRNSGILCLLQHGIPPRFRNGSQNYIIDLLLNKRTDCHNLVFLLLLPIFHKQLIALFFCKGFLHGGRIRTTESRLCTELGKSDQDIIAFFPGFFSILMIIHHPDIFSCNNYT